MYQKKKKRRTCIKKESNVLKRKADPHTKKLEAVLKHKHKKKKKKKRKKKSSVQKKRSRNFVRVLFSLAHRPKDPGPNSCILVDWAWFTVAK